MKKMFVLKFMLSLTTLMFLTACGSKSPADSYADKVALDGRPCALQMCTHEKNSSVRKPLDGDFANMYKGQLVKLHYTNGFRDANSSVIVAGEDLSHEYDMFMLSKDNCCKI